ncbi:MAG TPA: hypothetical protein VM029_06310 [Opitutaceae bacterium]|nr:hypothetical protein [Opitutaceae bacterium]
MKTSTVALIALLGWTTVCCAAERDDVQAAFDGYKSAILSQDGARAAELVSERTLAEYQRYVDWARDADRETLQSLSLINRFQVIILRHRIPPEELRKLEGRTAFIYAVDHDWIGKNAVIRTSLGEIDASEGRATATVLIGGRKAPNRFQFIREKQQWRFDLLPLMQDSSVAFQALAKQRGIAEDELIFNLVETVSGKKVPEGIWNPAK